LECWGVNVVCRRKLCWTKGGYGVLGLVGVEVRVGLCEAALCVEWRGLVCGVVCLWIRYGFVCVGLRVRWRLWLFGCGYELRGTVDERRRMLHGCIGECVVW
jgi:hypothetical protein